ncbi:hypothetical protein X801_00060 [Opisthorchis viverrini]|uniref:Uncharacterized protein n=1 Tax=Opisthorchis viverrini TaxID=6198 RepID=A0A1S8XBF0_OPIVI|nr:hypothetical protein X801_00060 [Opisthorchis viverrini]
MLALLFDYKVMDVNESHAALCYLVPRVSNLVGNEFKDNGFGTKCLNYLESLNCHFMLNYTIHLLDSKRRLFTVGLNVCIIEQLIVFFRALAYGRKHKMLNTK